MIIHLLLVILGKVKTPSFFFEIELLDYNIYV